MYYFHSDAGHGWLAVPRKDLAELGLLNQISFYSYENGKTVYLEEDTDMSLFIEAFKTTYTKSLVFKRGKVYNRSHIRDFARFKSQ